MIEMFVIALLLLAIICFAGVALLYFDFVFWIVAGKQEFTWARRISDKVGIVVAVFFLFCDYRDSPPAYFYWLALSCLLSYFYCSIREKLGPALPEIIVNYLLMIAVPGNALIGIKEHNSIIWIFCTIPIEMLLIMTIADNNRLARQGVPDRGARGNEV